MPLTDLCLPWVTFDSLTLTQVVQSASKFSNYINDQFYINGMAVSQEIWAGHLLMARLEV